MYMKYRSKFYYIQKHSAIFKDVMVQYEAEEYRFQSLYGRSINNFREAEGNVVLTSTKQVRLE